MAVLKTVRSLFRSPNCHYLVRHSASAVRSSSPSPALSPGPFIHVLRLTFPNSRLFSPLCSMIAAPPGPLFLASPAWKLLQSATPLYLQPKEATFFRELIRGRVSLSPDGVGVRSGEATIWGGTGGVSGKDECSTSVLVDGGDDGILNLPNLISICRMVSGPLIGLHCDVTGITVRKEMEEALRFLCKSELSQHDDPQRDVSFFICRLAVSGMTDWLDGFVARKMKINSVLGSYLDPLADKVLIGCVAFAMAKNDLLHPELVLLVIVRDIGLISGAVFKRASNLGWKWISWSEFTNLNKTQPERVEPLLISKVNTVLQLTLVAAALLQPEFGTEETEMYLTCLSWLVASTTVASTAAYGAQYLCKTAASVNAR